MTRKIILLITGVLLAAAVWLLIENRPTYAGPEYNGRTARQWLGDVFVPNRQREAMAAFREMGTNAYPVLIQRLAKKDTETEKLNRWIYPRLPAWLQLHWKRPVSAQEQQTLWSATELIITNSREKRQLLPDLVRILEDPKCGSRQYTLTLVATMAGPHDPECVPVLIDGLSEKEFGTRYIVFNGLMNIGPPAKAAVPVLWSCFNDTNLDIRVLGAVALWKIDGQTNQAVVMLREALAVKGYSYMRGRAFFYLHQIDPHDESLIPIMIARLEGTDDSMRLAAVSMLGNYGAAAKDAVPALTNLMTNSTSRELHDRVLVALKRIDPETAAKYEDLEKR
jgi:hypothetical protein